MKLSVTKNYDGAIRWRNNFDEKLNRFDTRDVTHRQTDGNAVAYTAYPR